MAAENVDVKPVAGMEIQTGLLLAMLDDATQDWRQHIGEVSEDALCWQPMPNISIDDYTDVEGVQPVAPDEFLLYHYLTWGNNVWFLNLPFVKVGSLGFSAGLCSSAQRQRQTRKRLPLQRKPIPLCRNAGCLSGGI